MDRIEDCKAMAAIEKVFKEAERPLDKLLKEIEAKLVECNSKEGSASKNTTTPQPPDIETTAATPTLTNPPPSIVNKSKGAVCAPEQRVLA